MGCSTGDLLVYEPDDLERIFAGYDGRICVHAESELMLREREAMFAGRDDPAVHSEIRAPEVAADVPAATLVVNATSVGMGASPGAAGPIPLEPALIDPRHVVVDLVYQPVRTPLLEAAERQGAVTVDGLGMLVHQAALSIERWTGVAPDTAAMSAAARS